MNLYQLPVLLTREVQEHKGALLIAPVVVAAFLVAIMIMGLVSLKFHFPVQIAANDDSAMVEPGEEVSLDTFFGTRLQELADAPMHRKEEVMRKTKEGVTSPLMMTLWIVVFFYLLGTLYDERKDRSILFWKSMPVSDGLTVVSKLLTAAIVAPAIYFVVAVALQVLTLVLATVAALGHEVPIWNTFWAPSHLFSGWFGLVGYFIYAGLWCLPYFGWMLFVSAFARSLPFLWALGVPFGISIMERVMTHTSYISHWMGRHITGLTVGRDGQSGMPEMLSRLTTLEFAVSLIVGLAFIYGAIWMRGRGDEI